MKTGRRVWFGGINENADKTVFNPNWGIDTTKYIVPVKYPSTAVIKNSTRNISNRIKKTNKYCILFRLFRKYVWKWKQTINRSNAIYLK